MRKFTAILLFCIFYSCKYKAAQSPEQLRETLKKTWVDYLYQNNKYDSAHVKYEVLDVVYYENPDDYVCEFKVHVKDSHIDTTGMMSARISKDMTKVARRY
ncbi:MAG TPA: hypothetical protein VHB48_01685 [Chitinophagaceae bacterium]|jgi:hypothetical protein|nr:hypothetical protein [Chitinophagaceae bacterium]